MVYRMWWVKGSGRESKAGKGACSATGWGKNRVPDFPGSVVSGQRPLVQNVRASANNAAQPTNWCDTWGGMEATTYQLSRVDPDALSD